MQKMCPLQHVKSENVVIPWAGMRVLHFQSLPETEIVENPLVFEAFPEIRLHLELRIYR